MSFSTVWDIVGILAVAYVAMRLTFYVASDWTCRRADRADGQETPLVQDRRRDDDR